MLGYVIFPWNRVSLGISSAIQLVLITSYIFILWSDLIKSYVPNERGEGGILKTLLEA